MIIYQVTSNVHTKNKIYIGKTIRTLKQRQWEHYNSAFNKNSQTYFHRALRKYNKNNFKWKTIHQCKNEKELNETEIYYIDELNSFKNGYNMTPGGDGGAGMLGKKHSLETRKKISEGNKGKKYSKKVCKKMSKAHSGKNHYMYGKEHSKETRKKISDTNSDMWLITTPDNKEILFKSLSKFCKQNNLNYSGVKGAVRNKRIYKDKWFFKKVYF